MNKIKRYPSINYSENMEWEHKMRQYIKQGPIAVAGITNTIGIAIFEIDTDERYVVFSYSNSGEYIGFKTAPLDWEYLNSESSLVSFTCDGAKYYVDNFIRI